MSESSLHQLSRSGRASGSTRSRGSGSVPASSRSCCATTRSSASPRTPRSSRRRSRAATRYDEQLRELIARDRRREGDLLGARDPGHRGRLRRAPPGLGRRARAATATSRSRSTRRSPTTARRRSSRRCACTSVVDRPEPVREDPGDRARPRRDRGLIAARQADQRHADLLARPLPRGDRGLHPRARAARRGRRRPDDRRVGRELLRLPGRHRGRPAARRDRHRRGAGAARASSRSRTRSSPTQHFRETFSGPRWEALAPQGATPQRCLWASTSTKNPAYRDVLYVEELIGPDTVNTMPPRRSRRSRTTARSRRTLDRGRRRGAAGCSTSSRAPASTTTTSPTRSSARACRSSPTRSTSCSRASRAKRGELAAA